MNKYFFFVNIKGKFLSSKTENQQFYGQEKTS